jgi:hypothetical protein
VHVQKANAQEKGPSISGLNPKIAEADENQLCPYPDPEMRQKRRAFDGVCSCALFDENEPQPYVEADGNR